MIYINDIPYSSKKIVLPTQYEGEIIKLSSDSSNVTWKIKEYPVTQIDQEVFFNRLPDQHINPSNFNPEYLVLELVGTYYIIATEKDCNGNYSQTKIYIRSNSMIVNTSLPFRGETDEINDKGWGNELLEYTVNLTNLITPLLLDHIFCGHATTNGNENIIYCGNAERIVGATIQCGDAFTNCPLIPENQCDNAPLVTEMEDDDQFCIADVSDVDTNGNPIIKKIAKDSLFSNILITNILTPINDTTIINNGNNQIELLDISGNPISPTKEKIVSIEGTFSLNYVPDDVYLLYKITFSLYSRSNTTNYILLHDFIYENISTPQTRLIEHSINNEMFNLDLSSPDFIRIFFTPQNTGTAFSVDEIKFSYTQQYS